jgi:predicted nucleotidyltransferase
MLSMQIDLSQKYNLCLSDFVNKIKTGLKCNVHSIILHGGIVRDKTPIEKWSDIDIILILEQHINDNYQTIANIVVNNENAYNIRLDINIVYLYEIIDVNAKKHFYNSEIINALNLRGATFLFSKSKIEYDIAKNEAEAAYIYISNTLNLFRRYLIEIVYKDHNPANQKIYLQRLIRWTFSILRSSLRIESVFLNPYTELVGFLIENQKLELNSITLLSRLVEIRQNYNNLEFESEAEFIGLVSQIENFVEQYTYCVLKK